MSQDTVFGGKMREGIVKLRIDFHDHTFTLVSQLVRLGKVLIEEDEQEVSVGEFTAYWAENWEGRKR